MSRTRALGYGALVAVVVFYYLAVPTLRDLVGPAVVLPAYVAVAVLAGVVTYHAVRYFSGRAGTADVTPERAGGATSSGRTEPAVDVDPEDDRTVDELLEEIETGREE